VVEIASDVKLRDEYNLADGDEISVEVGGWYTRLRSLPRKDHRGVDLISDALPFGGLWYGEPNAESNAIDTQSVEKMPPTWQAQSACR
jgi:hypothetical protein